MIGLVGTHTVPIKTCVKNLIKSSHKSAQNIILLLLRCLVRRQLLTPKNANNLHKLRDFGNDAAHEANIQSENTLNRCIDIIEHLLKDIYSPEISS